MPLALTDHGLSRKPVMEGAGGAAGEAYAWAVENPDKVSCIYGENPVLRSHMSKKQPLDLIIVQPNTELPMQLARHLYNLSGIAHD